MSNKAVFFDRDGTINVDKNYLYKIDEFEFIPGVIDLMSYINTKGYKIFIVTNQSGVARGYYSEYDVIHLNNWLKNTLVEEGVEITDIFYCPHHKDGIVKKYAVDCSCRKPKLELFYKAIDLYDIDVNQSYVVGDKIRDCSLCFETNCHGFLVGNNEKKEIIEDVINGKYRNIEYCQNIIECMNFIN